MKKITISLGGSCTIDSLPTGQNKCQSCSIPSQTLSLTCQQPTTSLTKRSMTTCSQCPLPMNLSSKKNLTKKGKNY